MKPRQAYYLPSQRGVLRTSTRLQSLLDGSPSALDVREIEDRLSLSRNAVNMALQKLLKGGKAERVCQGMYKTTKPPEVLAPVPFLKAPESFIRPVPLSRMMAGR